MSQHLLNRGQTSGGAHKSGGPTSHNTFLIEVKLLRDTGYMWSQLRSQHLLNRGQTRTPVIKNEGAPSCHNTFLIEVKPLW